MLRGPRKHAVCPFVIHCWDFQTHVGETKPPEHVERGKKLWHTAESPKMHCGDPKNMLWNLQKDVAKTLGNPLRIVIMVLRKKNREFALKERTPGLGKGEGEWSSRRGSLGWVFDYSILLLQPNAFFVMRGEKKGESFNRCFNKIFKELRQLFSKFISDSNNSTFSNFRRPLYISLTHFLKFVMCLPLWPVFCFP